MKYSSVSILVLSIILISGCMLMFGCSKEVIQKYPSVVYKALPGEFSGGPIQDNLVVRVVDAVTKKPLKNSNVYIHQDEPMQLKTIGETDSEGQISFKGQGISGPVTVTVTNSDEKTYDTITFIDINSAQMTIPLNVREAPEEIRTALDIVGFDPIDDKLTVYKNERPFPDMKLVTEGQEIHPEKDPITLKVPQKPFGISALVFDAADNIRKYGFIVEPDGPLPVTTPAIMPLTEVRTDNAKMIRGTLPSQPANLDAPTDGWDPFKRFSMAVFADGGMAGPILSGFGNIYKEFKYQAFCSDVEGMDHFFVELSAFNRRDVHAETTISYYHGTFQELPETYNFEFKNVAKDLVVDRPDDYAYPTLKWLHPGGDMVKIIIRQDEFDYTWDIYAALDGEVNSVSIPPLPLEKAGSLLVGEVYNYRVESWWIPDFDYTNMSFNQINRTIAHKSRSQRMKFMIPTEFAVKDTEDTEES